jgi:ribonuclease BN (tRNA processing enzyme)
VAARVDPLAAGVTPDLRRDGAMGRVTVQFLGSGDAFGSGGRFHTCFFVRSEPARFLIDCGASSLIAMKRFGVDPAEIDMILLTHLHGDHFGGLPFVIIDQGVLAKRTRPLVIAGPPGMRQRVTDAMEIMFPESSRVRHGFPLEMVELQPERPHDLGALTVTPYVVQHPCGSPPLALRVECDGRVISYSGDTAWTDSLIRAARGADLFIAEAYTSAPKVRIHLDLATLVSHLGEISAKRLILTHLSAEMLERMHSIPYECAEDGMSLEI